VNLYIVGLAVVIDRLCCFPTRF